MIDEGEDGDDDYRNLNLVNLIRKNEDETFHPFTFSEPLPSAKIIFFARSRLFLFYQKQKKM